MKKIKIKNNYRPFVKNQVYSYAGEGFDWIKLRLNGKLYYVPKCMFEESNEPEYNELEYLDDFYSEEN